MTVVTRQRAQRDRHPIISVGDLAWRVPRPRYRYGTRAVRVRLLGGGTQRHSPHHREVTVLLLDDDLPPTSTAADDTNDNTSDDATGADAERGGDQGRFGRWLGPAGAIVSVPDVEVGTDALRDHVATSADPAADAAVDSVDTSGGAAGLRYRIPPKWAFDLFCPVHGYIHVLPDTLCEGERQDPPPLAGDAIRLAAPWSFGAPFVRVGDIGVLDGCVGIPAEEARVTFNARSFRDDTVVSSSGGPGTISTPITELTRTPDTVTMYCWQWRDGFARAHNGIRYPITVPVWDWHPAN